jgi:hypothetical protein
MRSIMLFEKLAGAFKQNKNGLNILTFQAVLYSQYKFVDNDFQAEIFFRIVFPLENEYKEMKYLFISKLFLNPLCPVASSAFPYSELDTFLKSETKYGSILWL